MENKPDAILMPFDDVKEGIRKPFIQGLSSTTTRKDFTIPANFKFQPEASLPTILPSSGAVLARSTSSPIERTKFTPSSFLWLLEKNMKQIFALIVLLIWTIIDFLCCSLTNRWLKNVLFVSAQVLSELFIHTILSITTIIISIVVNIQQYRKFVNQKSDSSISLPSNSRSSVSEKEFALK